MQVHLDVSPKHWWPGVPWPLRIHWQALLPGSPAKDCRPMWAFVGHAGVVSGEHRSTPGRWVRMSVYIYIYTYLYLYMPNEDSYFKWHTWVVPSYVTWLFLAPYWHPSVDERCYQFFGRDDRTFVQTQMFGPRGQGIGDLSGPAKTQVLGVRGKGNWPWDRVLHGLHIATGLICLRYSPHSSLMFFPL